MTPKRRLEGYLEELLASVNVEHYSDREELIDEVYRDLCRFCEIEECGLCFTAKKRIEEELPSYLEG